MVYIHPYPISHAGQLVKQSNQIPWPCLGNGSALSALDCLLELLPMIGTIACHKADCLPIHLKPGIRIPAKPSGTHQKKYILRHIHQFTFNSKVTAAFPISSEPALLQRHGPGPSGTPPAAEYACLPAMNG